MPQNELETLHQYFGYTSFRRGQEEIIRSILEGRDTVGIMPTGGGKSLCYQIPALMLPGVTLVISPLISLMKDQVDSLSQLKVPSAYINSSLGWSDIEYTLYLASKGEFKLIYIAPERLESESFMSVLKGMNISLLAVDEAHCVSQWGHDFRPSYLSIAKLTERMNSRPVIAAFTATATEQVKQDIIDQLWLCDPNTYVTGFNRENLFFSVVRGEDKLQYITDYLNSCGEQPGIIYAATRKEVDKIFELLCKKGFKAGKYHAGLSDSERSRTQNAFSYDEIRVMVATNAFGMGIDKSNVRFVIHFNMPKNMEAYYQEAGRAGRDGDRAECILLYGPSDIHIQKFLIEQGTQSPERKAAEYSKLQDMADYCHTSVCLRKYILEYFGEEADNECGNCGNCTDESELSDITTEVQKILSCVKRMGEQYGANLTANVLKGSSNKKVFQLGFEKLSTYGIMREYTLNELVGLINLLAAEEYLYVAEGAYPVVRLGRRALPVLKGQERVMRKLRRKAKQEPQTADRELFELLKALRKQIAYEQSVPPYVIFNDSTLREMSTVYPVDYSSMMRINGVGQSRFEKYGNQFIEAIAGFCAQKGISPAAAAVSDPVRRASAATGTAASHLQTYELYSQGKSPEEIAQLRELTLKTVEDHIIQCGNEGKTIEWDKFFTCEQEALVLDAVRQAGVQRLRPIKDVLPYDISYFIIKSVLCKNRLL